MESDNFTKKIIPWTIAIAMFIETLDATIINTAIPVIAKHMSVNPIDLKIALISYLLSLALFIPISGWIADRYGQRNVFISAIAIFTISSVLCGLSNQLWELVIARMLQGFGGALMMPVGRLIIARNFERNELVHIMNRVVTFGLLGPFLGPLLGGVITQYFSWRWIFFVNVPFGLLGFVIAAKMIVNTKDTTIHSLDKLGFILFGTSLAILVFTLSALSESEFSLSTVAILFCIAIASLVCYFFRAKHSHSPVLDISLLKIRTFCVSIIGSLLTRIGVGGIPFLLPLLFQVSFHYSPVTSGLLCLPLAFGAILAKRITSQLLVLLNIRKYLLLNTILLGISIISLQLITASTSFAVICILVAINGAFSAIQYSGINPLAYSDLPKEKLSNGTSIASTMQQLSMSFGVALSAFLLILFGANTKTSMYIPAGMIHHTFTIQGIFTILSATVFLVLHTDDARVLYDKQRR